MAGSSSTPTDLSNLIQSLSVNGEGSTAQQALSSILGVNVPLDAGVEAAAGAFAEKLGLQSKNSMVQTATFVITKAAILEGAQLIGIGGGLAKLDLGGFQMAQLLKQVEEMNKKLDVILSTPLQLAVDFLGKAMRHMESQNAADTIKELEKVKDHAMQAFHYTKGQRATTQNLKNAVMAKQLTIMSEILTKSFDGTKIIPFSLLDEQKKRTISFLIEDEVSSMQKFHDSYSSSMFTLNKAEKAKKKQDILDGLLRTSYPFISEGRGFTNALGPVKLSIKILPHLLPEGEEDSAYITIGRLQEAPLTVKVWRENESVMGRLENGESWRLRETGAAKGKEGEMMLSGCIWLSFYLTIKSDTGHSWIAFAILAMLYCSNR